MEARSGKGRGPYPEMDQAKRKDKSSVGGKRQFSNITKSMEVWLCRREQGPTRCQVSPVDRMHALQPRSVPALRSARPRSQMSLP